MQSSSRRGGLACGQGGADGFACDGTALRVCVRGVGVDGAETRVGRLWGEEANGVNVLKKMKPDCNNVSQRQARNMVLLCSFSSRMSHFYLALFDP